MTTTPISTGNIREVLPSLLSEAGIRDADSLTVEQIDALWRTAIVTGGNASVVDVQVALEVIGTCQDLPDILRKALVRQWPVFIRVLSHAIEATFMLEPSTKNIGEEKAETILRTLRTRQRGILEETLPESTLLSQANAPGDPIVLSVEHSAPFASKLNENEYILQTNILPDPYDGIVYMRSADGTHLLALPLHQSLRDYRLLSRECGFSDEEIVPLANHLLWMANPIMRLLESQNFVQVDPGEDFDAIEKHVGSWWRTQFDLRLQYDRRQPGRRIAMLESLQLRRRWSV